MQDLVESVDENNIHVTTFAPIVYQATAQAKTEKNAIKAFTLSDFACDLVRIVKGGIRIMTLAVNDPSIAARGIASGVKTVLTPKHWIDFASGTLKLIMLFVDEAERQDSLDNSCMASAIFGKPDLFLEECEEYEKHCQAQKKALKLAINKTASKLKKMSDEELIEGFFKHGTIFVLDLMAFNAAALATTYEGRVLVSQYAEMLSSPAAEQVAFEAAGVGKLSLEEGVDAANMALEIVEKNPKLIKTEGSLFDAAKKVVNAANKRGKDFENFLEKQLGGKGSFKAKSPNASREFDGAVGSVWYEAKSGKYWDIKDDMLRGLNVTKYNGVRYELHSDTPIPPSIKDWLTENGIKCTEWL